MKKLSKNVENQKIKKDDKLNFGERKNNHQVENIEKEKNDDELNSRLFGFLNKLENVKIFGKNWNIFILIIIVYVVGSLVINHQIWCLLVVAFFVYIFGSLVEKHKNRIDEEKKRWIAHKYEMKDNKIWDKYVIIEFAPPKWLSPVEVWYLYDMEIWKSDIVCLLYKWAKMWIISLSYKDNWLVIVEKKWVIHDKNVPRYEVEFRNLFFDQWEIVSFPNDFSYNNLWNFKNSVKNYCKERWWITKKDVYFSVDDFFKTIIPWKKPEKNITYIPYGRLSWFTLWFVLIIMWAFLFLGSLVLGKMIATFGAVFACLFVIWMLISFSFGVTLSETANKHAVTLTEKWQEIAAEIHWYKRFLEACDERQFREFMRQDPLYLDKMLPYAIALGLENIVSQNLPKNLSVGEWSLADFLRFEKVII